MAKIAQMYEKSCNNYIAFFFFVEFCTIFIGLILFFAIKLAEFRKTPYLCTQVLADGRKRLKLRLIP